MKAVYGPLRSWRFGKALGVDPICRQPKVCNFKCVYCRLGHGGMMITQRGRFVSESIVAQEAEEALEHAEVDFIEFRGTGEPFLAKNLIEMVRALRRFSSVPIAVVTNASLFSNDELQEEVDHFDVLVVKLDAADQESFQSMNRPHSSIKFERHLEGIIRMRQRCKGSFRVQITLVRGNMDEAGNIAKVCEEIDPDMIYLNTPQNLGQSSISKKELMEQAHHFKKYKIRTVFDDA